jgi:putative hydrolase of the HAD superfamily
MNIEEVRDALWSEVNHVLIDMDGTLLDKYFDDYFWGHLVPEKYSEKHHMSFGKAKEFLCEKYRSHEMTLNWTDIDFWSHELALDIPVLKEQLRHLIDVHPYVLEFLDLLRQHKKKIILATNAHYKTVALKMRKTEIGHYFDRVVTSMDMGYPKEDLRFWERARKMIHFEKDATMFIDDTEDVLKTAQAFGIKYIILKGIASSKEPPSNSNSFVRVNLFKELFPIVR